MCIESYEFSCVNKESASSTDTIRHSSDECYHSKALSNVFTVLCVRDVVHLVLQNLCEVSLLSMSNNLLLF